MTIIKFSFENKSLDWRIEEFSLSRLTLLVGASGVGKTQILRALMQLTNISKGRSYNGVKWNIEFQTLTNDVYEWEGEFENKGIVSFFEIDSEDDHSKSKPKIKSEKIIFNGELIVERDESVIHFEGEPTIRLSQEESVMHLLKEEEKLRPAYNAIRKLDFIDHSDSAIVSGKLNSIFLNSKTLMKKYDTIEKIQESELPSIAKLYLVQEVDKHIFSSIKDRFCDIFYQIEDIKLAPLESAEDELPDFFKDFPFIQIKERGVSHWISQNRISSGMYRSLMQLSELYLCAEGTVFLIDEFENSLGINCINEVTNDILSSNRRLQFILTSHHPYIIDLIEYKYWKLVTRNRGVVKVNNIDKYNIGQSKHSAFMQLLQLEEYQTGQELE